MEEKEEEYLEIMLERPLCSVLDVIINLSL
jgi:hypothetical protein